MLDRGFRRFVSVTVVAAAALVGVVPAASAAASTGASVGPTVSSPQGSATSATEATPQAFPPCSNPPIAIAQWWKKSGWTRTGEVNKQYRFHEGDRVKFIWGGKHYGNLTSPRLPLGVDYNQYDVSPVSRPDAPRNAQRLVRSRNGDLYYTADHFRSFCEMGGGW